MALTRRPVLVVLAAIALLAGCDSGHHAPAPSPPPSRSSAAVSTSPSGIAEAPSSGTVGICSFAQARDVAKAFGTAATGTSVSAGHSGIGVMQCEFTLSSSNVGLAGTVVLLLRTNATRSQLERAREAASRAVAVSGVGEAAFYVAGQTTLQMIRRSSLVVIRVNLRKPAQRQGRPAVVRSDAVALAKVLARQI